MINCVIFGAGGFGDKAYHLLKNEYNILAYVDNDVQKQKEQKNGIDVLSIAALSRYEDYMIIIAARFPYPMVKQLRDMNVGNCIYLFDPRFGEGYLLYEVINDEICVPAYMDARYTENKDLSVHYTKLDKGVLRLFTTALDWVKYEFDNTVNIVEFGCGGGQFANMLFDNGYTHYTGYDFSNVAIKLAKKVNQKMQDSFIYSDVRNVVLPPPCDNKNSLYIAFEVLEHVKNDFEIIQKIPRGYTFLFSVPNFDSFNHVRKFVNINDIIERYGMFIELNGFYRIDSNFDKCWFLVKGRIV
jgi:hypothetical protein